LYDYHRSPTQYTRLLELARLCVECAFGPHPTMDEFTTCTQTSHERMWLVWPDLVGNGLAQSMFASSYKQYSHLMRLYADRPNIEAYNSRMPSRYWARQYQICYTVNAFAQWCVNQLNEQNPTGCELRGYPLGNLILMHKIIAHLGFRLRQGLTGAPLSTSHGRAMHELAWPIATALVERQQRGEIPACRTGIDKQPDGTYIRHSCTTNCDAATWLSYVDVQDVQPRRIDEYLGVAVPAGQPTITASCLECVLRPQTCPPKSRDAQYFQKPMGSHMINMITSGTPIADAFLICDFKTLSLFRMKVLDRQNLKYLAYIEDTTDMPLGGPPWRPVRPVNYVSPPHSAKYGPRSLFANPERTDAVNHLVHVLDTMLNAPAGSITYRSRMAKRAHAFALIVRYIAYLHMSDFVKQTNVLDLHTQALALEFILALERLCRDGPETQYVLGPPMQLYRYVPWCWFSLEQTVAQQHGCVERIPMTYGDTHPGIATACVAPRQLLLETDENEQLRLLAYWNEVVRVKANLEISPQMLTASVVEGIFVAGKIPDAGPGLDPDKEFQKRMKKLYRGHTRATRVYEVRSEQKNKLRDQIGQIDINTAQETRRQNIEALAKRADEQPVRTAHDIVLRRRHTRKVKSLRGTMQQMAQTKIKQQGQRARRPQVGGAPGPPEAGPSSGPPSRSGSIRRQRTKWTPPPQSGNATPLGRGRGFTYFPEAHTAGTNQIGVGRATPVSQGGLLQVVTTLPTVDLTHLVATPAAVQTAGTATTQALPIRPQAAIQAPVATPPVQGTVTPAPAAAPVSQPMDVATDDGRRPPVSTGTLQSVTATGTSSSEVGSGTGQPGVFTAPQAPPARRQKPPDPRRQMTTDARFVDQLGIQERNTERYAGKGVNIRDLTPGQICAIADLAEREQMLRAELGVAPAIPVPAPEPVVKPYTNVSPEGVERWAQMRQSTAPYPPIGQGRPDQVFGRHVFDANRYELHTPEIAFTQALQLPPLTPPPIQAGQGIGPGAQQVTWTQHQQQTARPAPVSFGGGPFDPPPVAYRMAPVAVSPDSTMPMAPPVPQPQVAFRFYSPPPPPSPRYDTRGVLIQAAQQPGSTQTQLVMPPTWTDPNNQPQQYQ
jgi:hypothetical protein